MPPYAVNGTWNSAQIEELQTSVRESDANANVIRFRDAGYTRLAGAMNHLRAARRAGEPDIDTVGFSRGAALALAFANNTRKDNSLRAPDRRAPRIRAWFRGSHPDVAGGNANQGLNAVAGAWL